jgi:hypothetical protein|tara:strand:+ start:812 stop:1063 length:252 start_codon:yes stop_codon:yes gene_type:complete
MPDLFSDSSGGLLRNLLVGGTLMVMGASAGWLLHLERAQASIRVDVAKEYVTKDDLNEFKDHLDDKFDQVRQMILLIPNLKNE